MTQLNLHGRGLWTKSAEDLCQKALTKKGYDHIKYSDVVKAMSHVANERDGYTHLQTDFDAFAFCHQMGFLHTEASAGLDRREVAYVFASPIHRRYAMTLHNMMLVLIIVLELRICAFYQVHTQTQYLIIVRSPRCA